MKTCSICGISENETRIINSQGQLYCRKHYLQIRKYGHVVDTIYDKNEIVFENDVAKIILKNKKCEKVAEAIIDLEDVDKILKYKWHIKKSSNTNYCITNQNGHNIFLHRLILSYDGNMDIDHINHNGLDNRKSNLRIISHSHNLLNQHNNSNGVKTLPSGRFSAYIMLNGKTIYLGTFDTFQEAKRVRTEYENMVINSCN